MSKKVLEVKNLYKNFRKKVLLKDLNFSIDQGEIVCFIGKNGVGKTTLFNIIIQNVTKNFGQIIFKDKESSQIALFNQERNLEEILRVNEILSIIKSTFKKDKTKLDYFNYLYDFLEIAKIEKIKVKHLSGGQKQFFSLFQTLMVFPKILFLDEYSNNLDAEGLIKIKTVLIKLVKEQNVSIVLASHKVEEIKDFVDRIYIIKNKKIEQNINIKNFSEKQIDKLFDII